MSQFPFQVSLRACKAGVGCAILGSLVACAIAPAPDGPTPTSPLLTPVKSLPTAPDPTQDATPSAIPDKVNGPAPLDTRSMPTIVQGKSRWVPVDWRELPGLATDDLNEAWPAWLQSCSRPSAAWARLCHQVAQLAQASVTAKREWISAHLQPYRVTSLDGATQGKLTAYYEPRLEASRLPRPGFKVPLYALPSGWRNNSPWFTRQEIETQAAARQRLQGKEIVYLADPIDAMVLHIQGSGLLNVTEPDGRQRTVRLAFAGTNNQPYKSIGTWLLQQRLLTDASWPGIKAWLDKNPSRVNELLWKNPRYVFFKETPLPPGDAVTGPVGAQNVPLTAGRSIAVDRQSIPYGTPVWLVSNSAQVRLDKLVLAQDTGSAIVGAVRADYYAGSGTAAGDLAGRINQPLQLWVLWPR